MTSSFPWHGRAGRAVRAHSPSPGAAAGTGVLVGLGATLSWVKMNSSLVRQKARLREQEKP